MRQIILHMHTTLDNRIANARGAFWEPFSWGGDEMAYINDRFRSADTWAMGRHVYEAVIPWWETVARGEIPDDVPDVSPVDREFSQILAGMTKLVFSRTLAATDRRVVLRDDLAAQLTTLKSRDGRDILLSCGPAALAPLAATPGLIDEYLLAVHPAVLTGGPRLFDDVSNGFALRLVESKIFESGCVILRYQSLHGS
jgi:dihydrofolate reductase